MVVLISIFVTTNFLVQTGEMSNKEATGQTNFLEFVTSMDGQTGPHVHKKKVSSSFGSSLMSFHNIDSDHNMDMLDLKLYASLIQKQMMMHGSSMIW